MRTRFTLVFALAWVLLMGVAAAMTLVLQRQAADDPRHIGGTFAMTEMTGQPITEASLRGKPTALFFGFTGCPNTCPTTLQMLTDVLGRLGNDADRLNVVFVTVDPGRDTPEQMRSYLTSFDRHIRGLTGTEAQLAAMAAAFHVQYRRVPIEGGDYTMEHTAAVLLLDARGRFTGAIPFGADEASLQRSLQAMLRT